MFQNSKEILVNDLSKGLWQDSLPSQQPENTFREAWNAVVESDAENSYGISNENANELSVIVEGDVRGIISVEERDYYLAFVWKGDKGELGIIHPNKKEYKKLTDSDKLGISCDEWVNMELKIMQPCNQLHLYFSTQDTYKVINIDDPCCEFEVKDLIRLDCLPKFTFKKYKRSGNLPNGTYWFFAKLRDSDGNDTNWFKISDGVHISGEDHKQAELSKYAINISLQGDPSTFDFIDLGVISTIGGITTVEHFDTIGYGNGDVSYLYRGKTGKELSLDISEVRARFSRYIKGKNLFQHEGRLLLYNLVSEHNLDYQRTANEINSFYDVWVVPTKYAEDFKGLRPNEQYQFAIQWNYIDGTSSSNFVINGRKGTDFDLALVVDPCNQNCELPRWRVEDTSKRLEIFLEDVHKTNDKYNDVVEIVDNDRDGNYVDNDLAPDEVDTIPGSDIKPFGEENPFDDQLTFGEKNMEAYMDCVCNIVGVLLDGYAPCDPCDDYDLAGVTALMQLRCLCEARTVDDEGGGGNSPNPIGAQMVAEIEALQESNPELANIINNGTCVGGNCGSGNGSCGSGGCGSCGGSGCGAGGTACSKCKGTGCSTLVENPFIRGYNTSGTGNLITIGFDYARNKLRNLVNEIDNEVSKYQICGSCGGSSCSGVTCSSCGGGCALVQSGSKCCNEGQKICGDTVCFVCTNGYWYSTTQVNVYDYRADYRRTKIADNTQPLATPNPPSSFSFDYIYDEDGCEIVGVKPKKYATGLFGYWETKHTYPKTEDCNCEYIYGSLAGTNVVLHKVPTIGKEPHFVSFSGGVPNMYDSTNYEEKDSFVFFISPRFTNIQPPKNLPKPLCPVNPFSINYVERTEANKSVIGSGLAISCFKGSIQGDPHVFPKHGVNSWERFDRSIEPFGATTFRGGTAVDRQTDYDRNPANVAPYIIHSLDFHLRRPPLDANDCLFELEVYGKGFRHGLGAEGEKPISWREERENQKGTRQSLLLNHYRSVPNNRGGYLVKCVNGLTDVDADSIVARKDEFNYPICNLWRESSFYTELEGPLVKFVEGDDWVDSKGVTHNMDGFYGGEDHIGDDASDRSFTGDTLWHQMPIHDIRAHLVTFTRYLPYQYGSPVAQTYIPLGMEGTATTLNKGTIEGTNGDSYVGYASFRRTSYISDKTGRRITTNKFIEGLTSSYTGITKYFKNLLSFIFKHLGIRNGGYIPASGDDNDYINIFGGLRQHKTDINGGILSHGERTEGSYPRPQPSVNPGLGTDRNAGDNYFYHLIKSNVWTWMNSDVNPAYRETGPVDAMEVYWPKLKNLKLDSSFPDGFQWTKTYLNRFYALWIENARWKLIFIALFLLAFVYGIGIWIAVEGIKSIVLGAQAIGGGTYSLQTIGGLIAFVIGGILFLIGIYWIIHWIKSPHDNALAENLVGMKNMRPDVKNGPEPPIRGNYPTYSFDTRRFRQFEDNYWSYNPDNVISNIHEVSYGMTDPYSTCICPEERANKIVYSNVQNINSPIDAWQNFKLNNYGEINPDYGRVMKLFSIGNKLFVHTTDHLLDLQTGESKLSATNSSILLENSRVLGKAKPLSSGGSEGYAGILDPNAAIMSNWGYIFADREAKQLYLFDGNTVRSLSDLGLRGFMQNNMGFSLLESFPDYKFVDTKSPLSVGYSFGVDHRHNRLIFTKVDYKPKEGLDITYKNNAFYVNGDVVTVDNLAYFDNNSFTRHYYPLKQFWTGRSQYYPKLYVWDRYDHYSFNKEGLWKHNKKGEYQNFYGVHYPFVVDILAKAPMGLNFTWEGIALDTEAYLWNGCDFNKRLPTTFDRVIVFNSYQSSGEFIFVQDKEQSDLSKNEVIINNAKGVWTFNSLFDNIKDANEPVFLCGNGIPELNTANIDFSLRKKLSDNYIGYRFIFDSADNVKLFMKKIFTKIDAVTITKG